MGAKTRKGTLVIKSPKRPRRSTIPAELQPQLLMDRARQQLAAIVEGSHDAILTKDLDGNITSWNKGAEAIFGYSAEEVLGEPVTILIPPDRHDEEPKILERIRRGERVDHYETIRRRKDGALLHISLTVSPIRDEQGVVVGASKIARDVIAVHVAREQQAMLLKEMQHRIKNVFSIASSLTKLLATKAATPAELAAMVGDRMTALARAHGLTVVDPEAETAAPDQPTTLHALVRVLVAPFVGEANDRFQLDGIDIPISSRSLTSLALVVNELITNAAKHGAWRGPSGNVRLRCDRGEGLLTVCWEESGCEELFQPPVHSGFGDKLSQMTVERQLGGTIRREWQPERLTVTFTAREDRL